MKKNIIIILVFLCSCSYHFLPFKGQVNDNYSIITKKSYDDTWNNSLTYLGAKGFKAVKLDKTNGIIETKELSFIKNYTFENAKGDPIDPKSYLILAYMSPISEEYSPDKPLYLKMNMQIMLERIEGLGTKVIVKLLPYSIKNGNFRENPKQGKYDEWNKAVRSSGVLENELFDQLK